MYGYGGCSSHDDTSQRDTLSHWTITSTITTVEVHIQQASLSSMAWSSYKLFDVY